jgi:hypothetical protein
MQKKPEKNIFNRGRGPLASRGIFRAKFVATRSAGFELVTSLAESRLSGARQSAKEKMQKKPQKNIF